MRILVCGDRHWTDYPLLCSVLDEIGPSFVIQGGAKGADLMSGQWAIENAIETMQYNADWARYGRGAGPVRNGQMLAEGKPDYVVAFHDDLPASKGTKDMVRRSLNAGLRVLLVGHGDRRELVPGGGFTGTRK